MHDTYRGHWIILKTPRIPVLFLSTKQRSHSVPNGTNRFLNESHNNNESTLATDLHTEICMRKNWSCKLLQHVRMFKWRVKWFYAINIVNRGQSVCLVACGSIAFPTILALACDLHKAIFCRLANLSVSFARVQLQSALLLPQLSFWCDNFSRLGGGTRSSHQSTLAIMV